MLRTRQLAAIMFTDIQGYTSLMQQDEQQAILFRDKHRRIFNSTTEKYNGRILQYYGDGTLSIFDSAVDAVHCAIEMQQGLREDPVIPVRVGIHTGDIMFSDEEILGDSVNIASRIESLAVAGSVFISDKVFDEIKNQASIQAIRLKTFQLKNVARPMEVYAIANAGLVIPEVSSIQGKTETKTPPAATAQPASTGAGVPFLATKLFVPPPRPGAVQRVRLTDRLQQALHGKLTLISAPAGFGKTTLVSEWAGLGQASVAWLSLEEADSHLPRFLTYFIKALQNLQSDIGKDVLALLQSSQMPPMEHYLAQLINDMASVSGQMVLVLDDYHLIDARPVDEALTFLLDHLPPQFHIIITTREDPILPLSRLRVRGQLTELRATDLRFTAEEAANFLNDAMGLQLSVASVAALEARTEGWIAGLQMAALSLQGRSDTTQFIEAFTGSHRFILDYLVEEVLLGQEENVREFLMQTAILDRLSGSLCDAVTARQDGSKTLSELERGNLFVVPLDDQRQWYRYHHLFAEMLRAHVARERGAQLATWHRRAATWYEKNGVIADAIHHAMAAEDRGWAARLIEQSWPAMDAQFQSEIWLTWFEKLPAEFYANRPVLLLAGAWAYLNQGGLEAGAGYLAKVEEIMDRIDPNLPPDELPPNLVVEDAEQFKFLPPSIVSAHAFIALAHGDTVATIEHAKNALALLPEDEHVRRGPAAALLGLAAWNKGELEVAHRAISDAMRNFERAGSFEFAVSGTFGLADLRIAQGRLRDAVRTYEQVLELVAQKDLWHIRGTADLYLGLGDLYREQGDWKKAGRFIAKSEQMGPQKALPDWPCRLRIAKGRLLEAKGDLEGALQELQEAEKRYYRTPIPLIYPIPARIAQLWIRRGELTRARDWARSQELEAEDHLHYLKEYEHLTLARLLLAEYQLAGDTQQLDQCKKLLTRLYEAAGKDQRNGSLISILILQALVAEAQHSIPAALIPLEMALALAAPEGYVHTFILEGSPMVRLLSEAAAQGILPMYTHQLLAAFREETGAPPTPAIPNSPKSAQSLVEPLSDRELEILQLIAEGLSNQDISKKLFLALSTVKGHNRNIFGKLGVQRRTEAVARGQALGLI